jgi:hypothetical protein
VGTWKIKSSIESDMVDTQDVLMERLKKLGLSSEFGLFMKSETSRMSRCIHGIHKSLHVSPHNRVTYNTIHIIVNIACGSGIVDIEFHIASRFYSNL